MSHQPQTSESGKAPAQTTPVQGRVRPLDLIVCDGCGRRFATDDGPGMIAAITGACPDCGGHFQLVDASSEDLLL